VDGSIAPQPHYPDLPKGEHENEVVAGAAKASADGYDRSAGDKTVSEFDENLTRTSLPPVIVRVDSHKGCPKLCNGVQHTAKQTLTTNLSSREGPELSESNVSRAPVISTSTCYKTENRSPTTAEKNGQERCNSVAQHHSLTLTDPDARSPAENPHPSSPPTARAPNHVPEQNKASLGTAGASKSVGGQRTPPSTTVMNAVSLVNNAAGYFFYQASKSLDRLGKLLRMFWPVLGPLSVSLAMLMTVIWAISAWLDGACDQAAIRTTSGALSWIIQIDPCQVVTENRGPPHQTSSGLAVIQGGQAVGQAVQDLVDSTYDAVLYSKVAQHVYETTGDMALELQSLTLFSQGEALGHLMESVHEELDDFLTIYTDFENEMKTVVSVSVANFRKLSIRFDNLVRDSDEQPTWHRILDSWIQDTGLGKWYHQFTPESALMATLAKSTSTLVPELDSLYQSSDKLVGDLKHVVAKLNDIKVRLQDEETLTFEECDRSRRDLLRQAGHSESRFTWLASWIPFQADPACDKGDLPRRCCIPLRKYVGMVDQQLLRVTNHIAQVSTVRGHFGELRKNLYHLRRSTEQSGRLTFSRDDKVLAHREATKLLMSFEDVDRKWKGMLMESGPPSGTVKRLGRT
jgi:hypothetical protein